MFYCARLKPEFENVIQRDLMEKNVLFSPANLIQTCMSWTNLIMKTISQVEFGLLESRHTHNKVYIYSDKFLIF